MNFYPLWPYFLTMAVILAVIATPIFLRTEGVAGTSINRKSCIDGLRGFLAFGVVFYHAALYHQYIIDGGWDLVPIPTLYTLLGQCCVALFFMITGYLFWSKLLKDKGRPRWIALYTGRLFRIGPLYLAAFAFMLLLVLIRQGYVLHEPPFAVFLEAAHWALLGFDRSYPDINGYQRTWMLLAGVTWTLSFEWKFYASLLFLALAARRGPRVALVAVSAAFLTVLLYLLLRANPNHAANSATCAFLFLSGMLVASLEANGLTALLPKTALSSLTIAVLALIYLTCTVAYAPLPAILLCAVFYLVASGADLFGLLACTPAIRLGNISFGIYLLQGLVLTIVFSSGPIVSFALSSPIQHWLVISGCSILLTLFASLMHVLVELPGITAGRRVISWLGRTVQPQGTVG